MAVLVIIHCVIYPSMHFLYYLTHIGVVGNLEHGSQVTRGKRQGDRVPNVLGHNRADTYTHYGRFRDDTQHITHAVINPRGVRQTLCAVCYYGVSKCTVVLFIHP